MSVEMPSGVVVAEMLEGIRFALGPAVAFRRDALDKIGGIAATADYYSDDFVLGNLVWAAGYKVIFSHHIVQHVLTPRPLKRTLGDQLRWMKSTRFSRPMGHLGTGLTYAMPFGILGLHCCSGARSREIGSRTLRCRFCKSGIAIDRCRMGNNRRPARALLVMALSGPRSPGVLRLDGQLQQPHFFLARRNVSLQQGWQNHSAEQASGECCGSEAVDAIAISGVLLRERFGKGTSSLVPYETKSNAASAAEVRSGFRSSLGW